MILLAMVALSGCAEKIVEIVVPEDAAAVANPVEASDESISAGKDVYTVNCVVCHGETGKGDGSGARGLNPPPSDLTGDTAQTWTDGALFYIVSEGVKKTSMPSWDAQLNEEDRWNVVNYMRTLK
jgi:mono/diheme cytochrome c family protein